MGQYLLELWQHRDLALSFASRDIKARYKQTIFGAAWAVLQPFSLMVVFTLVFSRLARIPTEGVPYPLFSYTTLIFWMFFATTISQGTISIVANSSLIQKIYFPRETLFLSVLLSAGLDLGIAMLILGALLVYYHISIPITILWIPVLLALQVLFAFAVICLTATVHVNFRDVGHAISLLLQLWMFATPVAYPLSVVPSSLLPIYLLNPMAPIVDGYRVTLLNGEAPNLTYLAIGAGLTLFLIMIGYPIFKRAERTFADVI